MHARLFVPGYLLTADDIQSHYQMLTNSFSGVVELARAAAQGQGRIGHFFVTPINLVASYLAPDIWFRVVAVGAWYGLLLLAGLWVGRLCRSRSAALLTFLVLATCQRLGFEHMPPNSYPLQNTIPFVLIFAARLLRREGQSPLVRLSLAAVFFLGLIINEFAFVLGLGLVSCEYLAGFSAGRAEGIARLKSSGLVADAAVLTAALALYLGFRHLHPSGYTGNVPDGWRSIDAVLRTAFFHVLNGTALLNVRPTDFTKASPEALVISAGLLIVTAAVAWRALEHMEMDRPWLLIAVVALLFSFYVTAPVAIVTKYQEWCGDSLKRCAYIDTRTAFLGLGAATAALCGWLLRFGRAMRAVLAVSLGVASGTTYLYNLRPLDEMRLTNEVWTRADELACASSGAVPDGQALLRAVDPESRVSTHPDFDAVAYWRVYIDHRRSRCD
ncbi:hypothetical protein [Chelatococcus sp. GCM10030263]|uniref:hypothetical protein n=1 Tax=Chelatococcus sp. GCM10030263 TaxID=3273387 RepID=UPI00366CFD07